MTGQIVTDGHTGVLVQADITDWNLQLEDQGHTVNLAGPLSGGGSYIGVFSGPDLAATQTSLSYDFNRPTGYFSIVSESGLGFVCLSSRGGCGYTSALNAAMYVGYVPPQPGWFPGG